MATISDTTIQFCGITLTRVQLEKQLPYPTYRNRIKEHYMSQGSDGPGIRVIEPLGAHISYSDFNFSAGFLTTSNIQTFENAFWDYRTPKTLVISVPGDSNVVYSVLFGEPGLEVALQDKNVEYYDDLYAARFNLKILSKV